MRCYACIKAAGKADYRQHSRFGSGRAANSSRIDVFHDRDFRAGQRVEPNREIARTLPSLLPAPVYDRKEN